MEEDKKESIDEIKPEKSENNHHNHSAKIILAVVAILVVFGGIACVAKVAIGRERLSRVTAERNFSFASDDFGPGRGGRMMDGGGRRVKAGNNLIGKITKIDGDNLTIHKDSNNKDYKIVISDTTQIRKDGEIAGKSDLANGQAITVAGSANSSGEILASLIIIN